MEQFIKLEADPQHHHHQLHEQLQDMLKFKLFSPPLLLDHHHSPPMVMPTSSSSSSTADGASVEILDHQHGTNLVDPAAIPPPTLHNLTQFMQLAVTFGFQLDFGARLLRWNPQVQVVAQQVAERQVAQLPKEAAEEADKDNQRKRKASSSSSSTGYHHHNGNNNHLAVPPSASSRRSSSASTVKAHASPNAATSTSPLAGDYHHHNGTGSESTSLHHPPLSSAQLRQLSPLLAQLPPPQPLTKEAVREYLANPQRYECALWIYHAKVAQKSYGNEKRFFCPPPCVYLIGAGWHTRRKALEQLHRQLRDQKRHDAGGGSGAIKDPLFGAGAEGRELFSELSASLGIGPPQVGAERAHHQQHTHAHQLDFSNGKDYCAAKVLFISDADKRKYFHLQAHFAYAGGALELGTFPSQRIKVISKPSKKKQSMKSSDCKYLCVGNGSKIALFNRLRSQTVSTRYLHVEVPQQRGGGAAAPPAFVASSTKWGAFHINVVDPAEFGLPTQQQQSKQYPQHHHPSIITYGSLIQLVDSQTEMRLPLMRIRKVDKQTVLLDPSGQGEPVSQLHKCAFQMADSPISNGTELLYLCLSHDKIIQHQASRRPLVIMGLRVSEDLELEAVRVNALRHQISDGAAWTIISTDKTEFRWAEPGACSGALPRAPITPVPQLHALNVLDSVQQQQKSAHGGSATIELTGANFTPALRVWFGATPADTVYCAPERLSCAVPSLYTVCADMGSTVAQTALAHAASASGKLDVQLLLGRDEDGVLFPTALSFTYALPTPSVTQTHEQQDANEGGGGTLYDNSNGEETKPVCGIPVSSNGGGALVPSENRFHPYPR